MTLGQRLKQLREMAGLSQNALAKKSGVRRPTISEVEAGNQKGLTLENGRRLARALGVTLDLLAGEGKDDDPAPHRLVGVA